MERLRQLLHQIDGKGYKQYKQLTGEYQYACFALSVDHVQGDPFAAASRVSVTLPLSLAAYPEELWSTEVRLAALQDYLARAIARGIKQYAQGQRGTGKSGEFAMACGGQQVLPRNAVAIRHETVETRLTLGLPADGRTILGQDAEAMLCQELPLIIEHGLLYRHLPEAEVLRHIHSIEDQQALRDWLQQQNLVGFIADGSVLPRRSGVDDRPLEGAQHFISPDSLRHHPVLPNAGKISGMGIPQGVSLIVGGGYHGKSTVLHALERGVYDHIPNDGRERVATLEHAVKVRAEDKRSVARLDISPFINHLPFGHATADFSSANASGSTSQAANIIEALHCGSRLLLIDEDTSATNFMIRDARMQALVNADKEPITPLLHRIRELYDSHGVSSIIVSGGSGDYFAVADSVIMMHNYQPVDVTQQANTLADKASAATMQHKAAAFSMHAARRPESHALNPARDHYASKIEARSRTLLSYGTHEIDLSQLEQLVDVDQTRTIGLMMHYYAQHFLDHDEDMVAGLIKLLDVAREQGLDVFSPYKVGNLALPRLYELAGAINRLRDAAWRVKTAHN